MFPNAYDGIKKIYLGEILSLISIVVGGIAGIVAVIGYTLTEAAVEEIDAGAALVGGGIVVIIAGILGLVAFVLNIVGISKASQDEPFFKKAMIWLVVGLAGSILVGMTSENEGSFLNLAADFISQIAQLFVTFYVIDGINSLANKLGRTDVAAKGSKLKNLIIGVYAIGLVLTLISGFMAGNETMETIAGILGIIALILMVIAYVVYLKLLSGAKKMLA